MAYVPTPAELKALIYQRPTKNHPRLIISARRLIRQEMLQRAVGREKLRFDDGRLKLRIWSGRWWILP